MLYDLNIAWSPTTTATELEATLRWAATLGYGVVALNHTLRPPIPSKISNPIPRIKGPLPSTPNLPSSTLFPRVLTRVTVTISDPAHNHRLPDLASAYDILALRPASEKAFQAACTSFSEHSLISLDLTAPLGFHIRPKPAMAAVNRGLYFEVCYGQLHYGAAAGTALGVSSGGSGGIEAPSARGRTDDREKTNFLSNLAELVRATRGRGIVLSSEASSALGVRGAADVVNLMSVYGLRSEMGMKAVKENPRLVVANEGIKRSGYRGVVDVIAVAKKPKDAESKEGGDETGGGGNSKKRKGHDNAGEGGGQGSQEQGGMSKRQAKKMRLALRKQQEEIEKGKGKGKK